MKAAYKGIACLGAVLTLVAFAGIAAAPSQTVTVAGGGSQTVNMGTYTEGDGLLITWSTQSLSTQVSGVVNGPSGFTRSISANWLVEQDFEVPHTGDYTLTLSNAGSTDATVQLTYEMTPFSPQGFFDNLLTLVIIILVVVVVIIIVIVVLVVVVGGKKKQQAAMAAGPQGIVVPSTPGVCPVCGSQTDTNAQFCAKCGARFH